MEQLNGFELAGKNIRLTTVDNDEENCSNNGNAYTQFVQQSLESEDKMNLNAQGRIELIAKLAEGYILFLLLNYNYYILGTCMQGSQNSNDVFMLQQPSQNDGIPSIATQCFMLSNMFDPTTEIDDGWELDVRDDVIKECNFNGGI